MSLGSYMNLEVSLTLEYHPNSSIAHAISLLVGS